MKRNELSSGAEKAEYLASRKSNERNEKEELSTYSQKKVDNSHRRENRSHKKRERANGFGGWLAAVISLGVVTLALGTMLTYGWMRYDGLQQSVARVQTQSVYELNAILDNLNSNLAKAKVAGSVSDKTDILTDIAAQSEMAEMIVERLPLDTESTGKVSSFFNRMGDSARALLEKAVNGQPLTESDRASLAYMHKTNTAFREQLNQLSLSATPKDMINAWSGKADCPLSNTFTTLQEGMLQTPKEIMDGPFAENRNKVTAKNLEGEKEITAPQAEQLCKEYFASYSPSAVTCTGEAIAQQVACYNLSVTTPDGEMMAQLTKRGGKVILFDSFKECSEQKFSTEKCITLATDLLTALGYEDMKPVWVSENGTTCNLNFVYEQNGVAYYPDMIKVKVCEERGMVTGLEALPYVINHTERKVENATLTLAEAKARANKSVDVTSSRLCVIPHHDKEILAYEFFGNAEDGEYYLYLDAHTGEEITLFTVVGTKQGRTVL